MRSLILFSLLLFSSDLFAIVTVKQFNERFTWIEVPSKYVKARLNNPTDGLSICWIEVKTPAENFDFITRRAIPYQECMHLVLESRKLLKNNPSVEIIGNSGSRKEKGEYFTMLELIRGKSGCVGYFGGCEDFEKDNEDLEIWKSKPIDSKLYP